MNKTKLYIIGQLSIGGHDRFWTELTSATGSMGYLEFLKKLLDDRTGESVTIESAEMTRGAHLSELMIILSVTIETAGAYGMQVEEKLYSAFSEAGIFCNLMPIAKLDENYTVETHMQIAIQIAPQVKLRLGE